ncbi:MAG: hypothetical protein MZW92_09085 [Comamonadaceae bacterium]|nr:hypothetical protein [Comamonadaceae bacterium]
MIPTFRTPEAGGGAFGNIASFYQNQQLLQQTPPPLSHAGQAGHRRRAAADRKRAGRAAQGADRDGVQGPAVGLPHPGHARPSWRAVPTKP